jgi:gas vesicle protein
MLGHIVYRKELVEQNENFIFVFLCLLFKYIVRKKASFFSFTHLHRKDEIKHLLQHHSVLLEVEEDSLKEVVVDNSKEEVVDSSKEVVVDNSKEVVVDSSKEVEDSLKEVKDNLKEVVDSLKEEDSSSVVIVAADNLMVEAVHLDEGYDTMWIELHLLFE